MAPLARGHCRNATEVGDGDFSGVQCTCWPRTCFMCALKTGWHSPETIVMHGSTRFKSLM